ncbi:MAG: hypothetical protein COA69_03170 [Robiginitomaculum sp.]|nr:MAG: hypothetical protein COA69_03170 [Robiginitomaculum sp.]
MKPNSPYRLGQFAFIIGAIGVLVGAIVHIMGLIAGPEWIRFLGAPDLVVESARQRTWLAPVSTLVIAGVLCVWAAYALSGAGVLRKLPLLRTVLAVTAVIFVVRGVIFLPLFLSSCWDWNTSFHAFHGFLSLYVFVLGMLYSCGLYGLIKEKQT